MSYGGEIVPDNRCDQSKRPPEEHKCYTKRCRTTWAMTPWEEVLFINNVMLSTVK